MRSVGVTCTPRIAYLTLAIDGAIAAAIAPVTREVFDEFDQYAVRHGPVVTVGQGLQGSEAFRVASGTASPDSTSVLIRPHR